MRNLKILVVDDDPISLMLICRMISQNGHACHSVSNALDAFEALSDKSYDALILDIEMPGINGFEASKFIRKLKSSYFLNIPIIALTAHKPEDILKKALDSGMDGVVTKPIDQEAFFELLATVSS